MSDLIRGGQVTFHKFRMLMQVSRVLSRLSFLLVMLSIGFSYYQNITFNEWQIGAAWVKKDTIKAFKPNERIEYPGQYGFKKKVTIKQFESDPFVLKTIVKFETALYKGLAITGIMLAVIIGGLLLFFTLRGQSIKQSAKVRGVFLSDEKDLKNNIKQHNKQISSNKPFELADFQYPMTGRKDSWSSGEQSHALILGATGAGKTKIIQDLVKQLSKRNQKAIIVDVKGDYIAHFYQEKRGDIILNPLDNRGKNWSFFNETDALRGFSTIARSLLPKESKSDPIWTEAARAVFAELANLYVHAGLSMSEFADKILKTDLQTLVKLLAKTPASKVINDEIEKAALSVLMVLATYLRPMKLYRSAKDAFSITDWVNDQTQQNFLFISSRADVKEDLNPIITAQVDIAVTALRSLKEESNIPKIWFVLDELPYFGQSIPSLKDGLAMARSFGGCFVLGTQDMSSIAKIYSDKTAEAISNNCKTKIFMNVEGKEAAEWCSSSLGEGEIEEWHEGLSYGAHEMRDGIQVNRNRTIRRIALASELMMLKAGEGFIKFAGFEPAKFKFHDCYFKKVASGYEENAELMEIFTQELAEGEQHRLEIEAKLAEKSSEDSGGSLEMKLKSNKNKQAVLPIIQEEETEVQESKTEVMLCGM